MADQNHEEGFENFESNFFSFESVLPTDPDRNFLTTNFTKLIPCISQ